MPQDENSQTLSPDEGASAQGAQSGETSNPPVGGGSSRAAFLHMLIAGGIAAVVLGWTLLSWAISLPFYIGLFFFLLFGLLIGAVMFRFGGKYRPIPKNTVWAATLLVGFLGWALALVHEAVDFPEDFTKKGSESVYYARDENREPTRQEIRSYVDSYLMENYPPGGVIGYFRFAVGSERITLDLPGKPKVRVVLPAEAWTWRIRTVLAIVFLCMAIQSQVGALAKPIVDYSEDETSDESGGSDGTAPAENA